MAREDYKEINENRKICNEEIYEEISEEEGIPISLVKDIHSAHSKFTVTIIKIGAFESIIYPYLGKIKAKLGAVKNIMSKMIEKIEKKEREVSENRVI